MTRDELLYRQLKGNVSLYRGVAILYAAGTALAAAFAIGAAFIGRFDAIVTLAIMGAGTAVAGSASWHQHKEFAAALDEVGSDPTGIDTCRTYSPKTAALIAQSRRDAKTLRQLWIAYGILGISMLGIGGLTTVFMIALDAGIIYTLIGVGLTIGGLIFLVMTVQVFRDWRAAKQLESLE